MEIDYKGTRWFKCDLHLHTPASKCFQDQEVTPDQWVNRAIEQGLNCVAVTDHNTGFSIDLIKKSAKGKKLTVFPGVEITCDTSKIHLLILFDVSKTTNDINDFLIKCDIKREDFGEQEAHTSINIFDVAEIATKTGALIIPAHIDEYNGLGSVSVANLEKFYALSYINAVQVVHKEFLNPSLNVSGNTDLKALLKEYYNDPKIPIDDATVKDWFTPVKFALASNLAILTFSDNPHEPKNSQHGLFGIGTHFTWIKMDEVPSLEGLRQAFLLPQFRVKNEFNSPGIPYTTPDLWIKSISISNSKITYASTPLLVEFSPQLNTLIGGRGSGKSSILRFIRGVFNRTTDLEGLEEIINDHTEFYQREAGRPKKGVLNENTVIEIEFIRSNAIHKVIASNITSSSNQEITIKKYNSSTNSWVEIADEGYIDFFEFEHYSQKQIYEIAQEPNALRERIDKAIDDIEKLKSDKEFVRNLFLEKSASIRTSDQLIAGKGKLETKIKDLDTSIKILQQSGIAELLTTKETFSTQLQVIDNFIAQVGKKENDINELIQSIEISDINYTNFDSKYSGQLRAASKSVIDGFAAIKAELEKQKEAAQKLKTDFEASISMSLWKGDYDKNKTDFEVKKLELEKEGIADIRNFEKLSFEKAELESELKKINSKTSVRASDAAERQQLQEDYLNLCKLITTKRREFVNSAIQDGKVKVKINPFRNREDFLQKLRDILQKEIGFEKDLDTLADICFNGNVETTIKTVREIFLNIRKGLGAAQVHGHFVNLVERISDAQMDEIELMMPEDEIEVQYKPTDKSPFKSLSTASAGQKTTAILTFILSHGKVPLILDQPEDDLDNRLVYELIVDRLKQAKDQRQIIVVTHNANIPVNGDAEYIISMDSESKSLRVLCSGTVEQPQIKKEICDVMEGTEQAFEMRSKRYKEILTV